MKKKHLILALLAAVMVVGLTVQGAMAYFTTYVRAHGGVPLSLHEKTTITEDVEPGQKVVTIQNTGTVPVFVRVKAIAPESITTLEYNKDNNADWYDGNDGYWYYAPMLIGGSEENPTSTTPFVIGVTLSSEKQEEVNVVVVYEATHNIDEDGNAIWE